MIIQDLTYEQIQFGSHVGCDRQVMNLFNDARPRYGCPVEGGWLKNVVGAICEYGWAIHRGIEWDGALGNYDAKDVGEYQIRGTEYKTGHLIVHRPDDRFHKPDDPNDVFILAILVGHSVRFMGWMFGADAQQSCFWEEKEPKDRSAFFVPQSVLMPMETIPSLEELRCRLAKP